MTIAALIRRGAVQPMRPWPRYLLAPEAWRAVAQAPVGGPGPAFLGLWADAGHAHALFMADAPLLASVRIEAGMFDALSPTRRTAAPFERMVHDLWGHLAGNGVDPRPLLDQGLWPVLRPLSARPVPNAAPAEPPEFLGATGPDLHQIPSGPIGGVMEAVHLRLTAAGETVVRLETGLGYAHRGILALMRGKPLHAAAALASRIAAGSTVAHAIAFARAAEAAAEVEPPPRGQALRWVMAEFERIASHLSDLGAAAQGLMTARCGDLQECVRRTSHAAFGHRLLMDRVVPGGVAADLTPAGLAALSDTLDRIAAATPALQRGLYLLNGQTVGIGCCHPAERRVARQMAGAASCSRPRAAMTEASLREPRTNDVDARLRLRLEEIRGSTGLLRELLAGLPPGPVSVSVPDASGEGLGVADGPRGDVWHWLRLDGGLVEANFARDPGWIQLPSIEAACRNARLSDIPLIIRSINPAIVGLEL